MKKTIFILLSIISIPFFLQAANTCECNIFYDKTSTNKTATSVETKKEIRGIIYSFKDMPQLPDCQNKCNGMKRATEKSWGVPQDTATMKVRIK